jgi:Protein of unknown function (DUF2867)
VPLDEFMPEFDFNEVHSTLVAASPERALAAAREVTARELPLMRALMGLRTLPARVLGVVRRREDPPKVAGGPVIGGMIRNGFVVLADREDELVVGVAGRFWALNSGIAHVGAEEFDGFDTPGHAKAVMDFHAERTPGGCLLSTETRIKATDQAARRSFGRYWRVVHPGSALIRRGWLRAVKRRAEGG